MGIYLTNREVNVVKARRTLRTYQEGLALCRRSREPKRMIQESEEAVKWALNRLHDAQEAVRWQREARRAKRDAVVDMIIGVHWYDISQRSA